VHRAGAVSLCLLLTGLVTGVVGGTALSAVPGTTSDAGEIARRLALPPFAYVAETDHDTASLQQGEFVYTGVAAVIDSQTDALAARPIAGASLQGVAVAPDGSRFYMTDAYEPVLHVFDADSNKEIAEVSLPGVEARDRMWMSKAAQNAIGTFPYSAMRSCSEGVACTPDGSLVLVASSAGLQVVDTTTNKVVRTLSDIRGGALAVSFDGKRAYVFADNFDTLAPRSFADWFKLISATEECRLVCIDLDTWQIVEETPCAIVVSIAVKPDDSQVFFSESYKKRVRVVDALTLEDLWTVSTEPSFSVGLGFVPNGSKAYVVCQADIGSLAYLAGDQTAQASREPTAEEYFCGVIDTAKKEIVKRIPLEAY
jgi:DNA-binding beta-propeller fold protein YncE